MIPVGSAVLVPVSELAPGKGVKLRDCKDGSLICLPSENLGMHRGVLCVRASIVEVDGKLSRVELPGGSLLWAKKVYAVGRRAA